MRCLIRGTGPLDLPAAAEKKGHVNAVRRPIVAGHVGSIGEGKTKTFHRRLGRNGRPVSVSIRMLLSVQDFGSGQFEILETLSNPEIHVSSPRAPARSKPIPLGSRHGQRS
jgi:hypothetical protein